MSTQLLSALVLFAFVSSITPGPNNMMLMASGVNFGFKRTIPHMLGVALGFGMMVLALGFGASGLFAQFPFLYSVLKILSIAYMLFLAYKIATAGPVESTSPSHPDSKPMTFLQACAFQWVNPKAWTMALTAISAYTIPTDYLSTLIIMTIVFVLVNFPSVSVWTIFGVSLRGFLRDAQKVRVFNIVMALLLVISLWPVLADTFK